MRRGQSSLSAAGIAIVRAIESERPPEQRICFDPYARRFVNGWLYRFVRFFDRLGYSERKGPGVMGFLVARERHIDETLLACLAGGMEQLVILGAGYDARAYRFEQLHGRVKIFEIDHPATQADKLAKVARIFGQPPAYVNYVPVDFNTERLNERLAAGGYESTARSLFIWQGVTQYLTPEAVDLTLAFVAEHAAPGSTIVFDYAEPSILAGGGTHGEVRNLHRYRWLSGETLTFGIPGAEIDTFLVRRGFQNIHHVGHSELHDLYFTGPNAARTVAAGYGIVAAQVKG
jgi:methyltransferase (TIGR00027 family)